MNAPLVFLDTETTGLSLDDDIWEFGAIRREPDGSEATLHLFIEHDEARCRQLPEPFLSDHMGRFPGHSQEIARGFAAVRIREFMAVEDDAERPHVVGAVPNFDTERLAILLGQFGASVLWHHHLIDVEAMAVGYLLATAEEMTRRAGADADVLDRIDELCGLATPPWRSDDLSRAVGVEPPGEGERHTALGDARWAMRMYDAMTGGPS